MPTRRDSGQVMLERAVERPVGAAWAAALPAPATRSTVESPQQRALMGDDIVELPRPAKSHFQARALTRGEEANRLRKDTAPVAGDDAQPIERVLAERASAVPHFADGRRHAESQEELLNVFDQRLRGARERRIPVPRHRS